MKKDGEVLYKLMNNVVYAKTVENLRDRISIRLVSNEKNYLKWMSNSSYMSQKIFDNDLVAIRSSKVTLMFNKPAFVEMCISDLSKVLRYEFHYDYIKNKYVNSRLLFNDTDSFVYEIKTEDFCEDFNKDKEMFDFSNYSAESKHDDSNRLVVGKMKDETGGAAIKEFVGLKPKMYSFFVDDSSEHKKAKDVNKNVETISHSEYKDVLLNKKCLRHSMNRI